MGHKFISFGNLDEVYKHQRTAIISSRPYCSSRDQNRNHFGDKPDAHLCSY